ncbi:hypothetical protein [Nocardiopsis sp. LOL_012]|uniref:hypothetical protein n=1 Tax=Nocardiopsis sp. LOL_012 TaxID=3345409 RepID=UPI003A859611
MELFLPDQRDILVTDDAVIAEGNEMTGAEVGELITHLDLVRLVTLWREMHREFPLGSWVRSVQDTSETPGMVIGYKQGAPGSTGHVLEVRSVRGERRRIPVAEASVALPPKGAS